MTPTLTQIRSWLLQAEVWRFVGLVSAVVGLLCYALSSSFTHLFGEWNLFKIVIYSVISFIVCWVNLFAKEWQHLESLRLKIDSAFFVLTITSVYSFFSDKVMNGKPDAYSIISCAAFAIMSLGLSRQTDYGFEVDLMYFFLAGLIVQLMKIKLLLFVVAAAFSYFLMNLRSFFPSIDDAPMPNNGYPGQQDGNSEYHTLNVDLLQSMELLRRVRTCVNALEQENSNLMDMLLGKVKESLEVDSESLVTDPNFLIDLLPSGKINDLHETTKLMVSAGLEKKSSEVYISWRRGFLHEFLINELFGLQDIRIEDVHKMPFKDFKHEIERWIMTCNVAQKILFPCERQLCDRVFNGFPSVADFSFTEVCRGPAIQLLKFADAVAIGSHSPARLFRILDMFETLRDLIPKFESMFWDQNSVSLRNEVITVWNKSGEAITGTFMKLANLIHQDSAKVVVPGGGIHPTTRYVMNYLAAACQSRQTLEQVFEDYGHPSKEYPKLDGKVPSSSSLSLLMDWIMELLESNLEAKSSMYKDLALCNFFLMNNGRYIVRKIRDSELGTLLGDDLIRKHIAKVQRYHVQYETSSWDKVLGILKLDNNGSVPLPSQKGVAESMKEKLKSFNKLFEDICRVQSSWFVFDEQLREEIRISLEKILLPAYENFIGRFRDVVGNQVDNYIKYGVFQIQDQLAQLFLEKI